MHTLNVHLLPSLTMPEQFAGKTAVVIDVLRATTTITHALANGAVRVIPCLEIDEARRIAAGIPDSVLGGERGGVAISGFDLDNSPAAYTRERVGGRTVVFTTTNGTRAMKLCAAAKEVWLASFVAFSAVCQRLSEATAIEILCAGTDGQITREDVLLAGAIADDLERSSPGEFTLNDQAAIAAEAWRSAVRELRSMDLLSETLKRCNGGRNLIEIGQERDIEIAAQIDLFDSAPRLNLADWSFVNEP